MVVYFVYVVSIGDIRFGVYDIVVSKLVYVMGVGDFNLFNGIYINIEILLIKFIGVDFKEEGEVVGDYEVLNVVGVGVVQ